MMNDISVYLSIVSAVCSIAVFLLLIFATDEGRQTDYEMQANCIAEYAYTNPQQDRFDNLITALERCR